MLLLSRRKFRCRGQGWWHSDDGHREQIKRRDVGARFIATETDVILFARDIRQAATNAFELLELS